MTDPVFWLFLTLSCILIQSFFTMLEMAMISFNRVRLEYYVDKNSQRAIWISDLLKNPARLFGTTLIGVNIALQIGSECSRMVYEAYNLNPDLSPLTQIIIVLIFGELAPLFAARRHPEHVAMLGIPIIYVCSKLFSPLIYLIGLISKVTNRLLGTKDVSSGTFLNREDLQKIIEDQDMEYSDETNEFNQVISNIFVLRGKTAKQVMVALEEIQLIPVNCTIGRIREIVKRSYAPYLPIYHHHQKNIVGITYTRDLINLPDHKQIGEYSRTPWFITVNTPIMNILEQFRINNQNMGVVLNSKGEAVGLITLDDILEELFGEPGKNPTRLLATKPHTLSIIDRSFQGNTTVKEVNATFGTRMDEKLAFTLSQYLIAKLGRQPEENESIRDGDLELTAMETSLMGVKIVKIRTIIP
jgi:putative hemolysin